jgi:hypothetical protein
MSWFPPPPEESIIEKIYSFENLPYPLFDEFVKSQKRKKMSCF